MEKNGNKVTPVKAAAKTADPVKKEEAVKEAVKAPVAKPEAAPKKEAEKNVKEVEKNVVEKKVTESKTTESKETEKKPATKKTAVKRTVKKAEEKIEEVFVQFAEQEINAKDALERAKQVYISEGHRESSIKSIRLYIKPEEHMAYYVINDKIAGGVPV